MRILTVALLSFFVSSCTTHNHYYVIDSHALHHHKMHKEHKHKEMKNGKWVDGPMCKERHYHKKQK